MAKSSNLGGVLVTAAVAFAVYKYMQLDKEKKEEIFGSIKSKASHLVNNSGDALDKVQKYMSEIKNKEEDQILDKILIVKNMIFDIFGSKKSATQNYKNELESGIN